MAGRAISPLLVVLALLVAGCGDDDAESGSDAPETVTTTTTTTTTIEDGSGDESGAAGDGAPPPATTEVSELTGFSSPSGNIGCFIDPRSVRCDIRERAWDPPAARPDCELDFGQGITLATGAAPELVCAGDTALEAGPPLAYGESIAAGLLRCESSEAGIECTDTETGRGFSLAREAYELF